MNYQQSIVAAGLIVMAGIAFAFLGPFGIILFALFILFICVSGELREHSPSALYGSPEQRAAIAEERARAVAPLKYYRWYAPCF